MKCDFLISNNVLVVNTSGLIDSEGRKEMLSKIVDAWEASCADAILIDHREAEINCSAQEAAAFGSLINRQFRNSRPCFIAVLVDDDAPFIHLVDISIMSSYASAENVSIKSFVEAEQAIEAITNRYAPREVVYLDA